MCGEAPKTVLSAQLYFAKPICGGRGSAANDSDTHSLNRCSNQRRKNNLNMDYESDDSPFVIAFPLPFRVLFLAGLGILGWAANLHGLRLLGVDAASALDLRTIERTPLPLVVDGPHHAHTNSAIDQPTGATTAASTISASSPVYRLAFWYGLWCSAAWAMYHSATGGNAAFVDFFKYIPAVCALIVLIFMLSPYDVMYKRVRDAFILYVLQSTLWTSFFPHM